MFVFGMLHGHSPGMVVESKLRIWSQLVDI